MPYFVHIGDDIILFNGLLKFEGGPDTCEGPFLNGMRAGFTSFVVCGLLFYLLLRAYSA